MINIAGAAEGRVARIASEIIKEQKGQSLIVVPTLNRARRLASDLSFFNALESDDPAPVMVLPPEDDSLIQYEARNNDSLLERMKVIKAAVSGQDITIIAPVTGAIRKLPPKEVFTGNVIEITRGQDVDIEALRNKLALMGYERTAAIESRGEYSIRGGIVDIFTPEGEYPYRIELFDTEVDSIRSFDPDTQRSTGNLKYVSIFPCSQIARDREIFAKASAKIAKAYDKQIKKLEKSGEKTEQSYNLRQRRDQLMEFAEGMVNIQYMEKFINYFYDETQYLWEYMDQPLIMIDDPARILETLQIFEKERADDIADILTDGRGISEDFVSMSATPDYYRLYDLPEKLGRDGYIFTPFVSTIKNAPFLTDLIQIKCRQTPVYNGKMNMLKSDVQGYINKGYAVTIVCSTPEREANIRDFVAMENLAGDIRILQGSLTAGMEFPDRNECFIWEGDIFGGSRRSRRPKKKDDSRASQIKSFADIKEGDLVVHESHGIGRFTGIQQLTVQGVSKDYLKVKYAGSDVLYIPVDQLGMLQKYIGGEDASPRLNKLSGNEWKATKAKAKAAVNDMAEELIKVSAARMREKGYAFSEDTVWQAEFEDSFPYTETEDQLRCAREIKADMERPVPMDRLLCGDVGFGKTEVAARALFKCVSDGKQAAVLVPTTLLANQHYYTLKGRFEQFPVKVEMLSRFRTAAQQKEIVKQLERGEVDLVIGTHRLLSNDIKFKDLGLLVVDEEQRFGVRHKEKIKQIRENIDVLTLSATPIPRTLHMSLSGIRDMSTIEEPPEDRYPVQTYVMEEDDFTIREAIEKELSRGGQVYVLYNRVEGINRVASDIKRLVPQARVAVGHGRMREAALEDMIMDFAEGEFDILVSTTIIESGMDIPNVNTMIVLDADRFGLAQLYQLRGRVGRSERIAYAYLMYRKDKNLSEVAEKRLRAIREFTEFGSGFKIAMKDLEIRGAGNLLGTEQSGHMLSIGYELYCKLLDEAVKRIETGMQAEEETADLPSADETVFNLPIPALIPHRYIDDEILRLQMYKKIAMVADNEDEADVIDELLDRFGDIPADTMNLIRISKIRTMAGRTGIREISQQGLKVKFSLWRTTKFPEGVIPALASAYGGKIKFNGGTDPYIRLTVGKQPDSPGYIKGILKELELFFEIADRRQKC
ncbi:MAG: transcription-repair coupling factor [Bacillota bacterium]|nr:transcription-repair coupling factor [Bacillota bacterium]